MDDEADASTGSASANLKDLSEQMKSLSQLSKQFGRSIADAFAGGVTSGRKFEDVLRGLGQRFIDIGLKAAFRPLTAALTGGLDQLLKSGFSQLGSLFGGGGNANAGQPLNILPFADGGVIGQPAYFPLGRSVGLMGERGAEAIMPLARGADGKLGVAANGGGRSVSVTVNIATPDIEGFRRGEAQVSAALARAVARGQRGL